MNKQHLLFVMLAASIVIPLQSLKAMDDANSSTSLSSVLKSPPVLIAGTIVAAVAVSRYLRSAEQANLEKVIKTSKNVEDVRQAHANVQVKTVLADRLLDAVFNNSEEEALICLNAGCSPHAATSVIGKHTGQRYTPYIAASVVKRNATMVELFNKY